MKWKKVRQKIRKVTSQWSISFFFLRRHIVRAWMLVTNEPSAENKKNSTQKKDDWNWFIWSFFSKVASRTNAEPTDGGCLLAMANSPAPIVATTASILYPNQFNDCNKIHIYWCHTALLPNTDKNKKNMPSCDMDWQMFSILFVFFSILFYSPALIVYWVE